MSEARRQSRGLFSKPTLIRGLALLRAVGRHLDLRDLDRVVGHLARQLDVVRGVLFETGEILVGDLVDLGARHKDVLAAVLLDAGDHAVMVAHFLAGVLDGGLVRAAAVAVADLARPGLLRRQGKRRARQDGHGESENLPHINLLCETCTDYTPPAHLKSCRKSAIGHAGSCSSVGYDSFPLGVISMKMGTRCRLSPILLFGAASLLTAQALSVQEFLQIFGKPQGIVAGPDGNVWFVEEDSSKVAQMDRNGNLLREIALPAGSAPHGVVVADGRLWFTEESANRIGKMDTAGKLLGEFPIPTSGGKPRAITAGPCGDGNLWFTEQIGRVGRIDTAGRVTELADTGIGSNLRGITRGPAGDCNLYVADRGQDCIVKVNAAGQIANIFFLAIGSGPTGVVAGPDGNLWFTENGLNRIGQLTTAGDVKQEATIPSPATLPEGIAVGPDGNIWFTEAGGNRVGRVFTGISPPPTPTPTPGGLTVVPRHGTPGPRPFRTP